MKALTFFKVLILTSVFFVIINYLGYFFEEKTLNSPTEISKNLTNYVNKDIDIIGNVGVALSTNLGTRHSIKNKAPVNLSNDSKNIGLKVSNTQITNNDIISTNMLFLFEYINILKTDVKGLLSNSTDRSFTLNSYIAQLEYRLKESNNRKNELVNNRNELVSKFNEAQKETELIKVQIGVDFTKFKSDETLENIDSFLKYRNLETEYRTQIIFLNKFLNFYDQLDKYNKDLIITLGTNKDILIKNSQIVIPNSGVGILKDLDLIFNENEWLNK